MLPLFRYRRLRPGRAVPGRLPAAAALLRTGEAVFSPVVHGHPLAGHGLPMAKLLHRLRNLDGLMSGACSVCRGTSGSHIVLYDADAPDQADTACGRLPTARIWIPDTHRDKPDAVLRKEPLPPGS